MALAREISGDGVCRANSARATNVFFSPDMIRTPVTPFAT